MRHYTLCAKERKKTKLYFVMNPVGALLKHSALWLHCFIEPLVTCVNNPR